MSDSKLENVFEAILKYGHDEDFVPRVDSEFIPTTAPAGSAEKLEILAERVRNGYPLWHEEDRFDYSGSTVEVRPVQVKDLFASIYTLLGIDPEHENMSHIGRPIKLVDEGATVRELMG